MFRFRSLFSKMLFTNLAIVLIVLFVLSGMLTLGVRSYYIDNTVKSMRISADKINDVYSEVYSEYNSGEYLNQIISVLSKFEDLSIKICDKYGEEYLNVHSNNESLNNYLDMIIENEAELSERQIETFGWTSRNESNMYSTPILSVSFPIIVENSVKGNVFMHKRLDNYESNMRMIIKRILFCVAISLVIACIATYLSYRNTIKTIKNINSAAGSFARGDFKKRVSIVGSDEVSALALTYNNMADELEKYEITRQSFVANVSHELRSPLTSIQGFVQGMLDDTISKEDTPHYLQIVLNETKRMNLLIKDLLDLAKIESGQFPLEVEKFDICEEIRRILINFITKIEDKEIVLTADIPDEYKYVLADKQRIAQVLTNLFDNAVKFCEERGSLKIWTYEADGRIHINISNTGSYIPEEDIPYVFDRFFKVDKSHTKKSPGTGIGLSIVRNIVIQHGEKIWVNSRKGTGTVFTFTLRLIDNDPTKDKKKGAYGRKQN